MIVTKYVSVIPKDVSDVDGVCTSTYPSETNKFEIYHISKDYQDIDFYDAAKDRRELWVLKGDETEMNNWITANSDIVTEKTFTEADAIGKELEPARIGTAHKVITEDGIVILEETVDKNIPVFDLQTRLDALGI